MSSYVISPKCPVCLNHYSNLVKPVILQPCCHGCCASCVRQYREISLDNNEEDIRCPKCREIVIEEKPNYDLIEMLPEEENKDMWVEKLLDFSNKRGQEIRVHVDVEVFSKLICSRLVNQERIDKIALKSTNEWTSSDQKIMQGFKEELRCCIIALDCDFEEIMKWVQVLNLPSKIESYIMAGLLEFYASKKFLSPMGAEWLLDLMPTSV